MKRGGTAPGESRKNKSAQNDLSKMYSNANPPRFQKINLASPIESNIDHPAVGGNNQGGVGDKSNEKVSYP
jgi:hypothetical protein